MRQFSYAAFTEEAGKDRDKYDFYVVTDRSVNALQQKLAFGLHLDIALWFQITCIFAAFAKVVTHRDVMHAWAIVFLWAVLHHFCRKATAWGPSYAMSLVLPSAALMPLEWCL